MAGAKNRSGGARQGAGRKKKERQTTTPPQSEANDRTAIYDKALKDAQNFVDEQCKKAGVEPTRIQAEVVKGLCEAIAQRELTNYDWVQLGRPSYMYGSRGEMKKHILLQQYDDKSRAISERAKELGFDLKIISETFDDSDGDGMFG